MVREGQEGEWMDLEGTGKGLDLIQGGAFQATLQGTEVGTTGDQRKILLGEAIGFAEAAQGFSKSSVDLHGGISLTREVPILSCRTL